MKITPVELRGIEFKKAMRGLDPKEVKFYIDQSADTIEELLLENRQLKERVEQYEKLESTIKEAVLHSEETRKREEEQAKKEAELIIREAKLEAEKITGEARAESEKLRKELADLTRKRAHFIEQFKGLLNSYLSLIEKETPSEIIPTTDIEETAIGEIEVRE